MKVAAGNGMSRPGKMVSKEKQDFSVEKGPGPKRSVAWENVARHWVMVSVSQEFQGTSNP